MSILKSASVDLRKYLLELFPVANLKEAFASKSAFSKEKICEDVAKANSKAEFDAIARFVFENLSVCKQHIYVFSHDDNLALPNKISGGEKILEENGSALFLVKTTFNVVKLGPPENDSVDFLWPIQIELHKKHLLVRFVVMEKDMATYFSREVIVRGKSLTEETVIASLLLSGSVGACDLNKGIKTLWAGDSVDAIKVKYKKPGSINTQSMDLGKGIKKNDLKLYEELKPLPLHMSVFSALDGLGDVGNFSIDPTQGFIGFTRYSKEGGTGNELINQILKNN